MQEIGNKLIEIHVTDSGLVAPGAGLLDNLGGMADGLIATPALMIVLIALAVAVPLSILAVVLSRLHHKRTNRPSTVGKTMLRLTPIAAILAIVAAPLLTLATPSPLDNTPISITIDKATVLSASDTTTVSLNQDATSHADIYAELDNDFNGYLNTDLTVSAANTNDSTSITNLSTTNNLIYSTNPVAAGDTTDFQIAVSITEDLPVGDYTGQVSFYGDFVQKEQIEVTFWCWGNGGAVEKSAPVTLPVVGDDILEDEEGRIGKTAILNVGDMYNMPTPNELGLYGGQCDAEYATDGYDYNGWSVIERFDSDHYYSPEFMFAPSAGSMMNAVSLSTIQPLFIQNYPEPVDEPWYQGCYVDGNQVICETYEDDILQWISQQERYGGIWYYDVGLSEWSYGWGSDPYQEWQTDWQDLFENHFLNNGAIPVYDGLELIWSDWG